MRENYNRVSRLIKMIKDNPFFDLERSGFSLSGLERLYLYDQARDQKLAGFLLDLMSRYPTSRIQQGAKPTKG